MAEVNAYPLQWPVGWKRTKQSHRRAAKFSKSETKYWSDGRPYKNKKELTVFDAVNRIASAMEMMGVNRNDMVISTNIETRMDGTPRSDRRAPEDPGAAVYWKGKPGQPMRCMAIDQYTTVADNLAAIAATLEAMRAIERHGGAEILDRSFAGFAALPSNVSRPWREVLGLRDVKVDRLLFESVVRELFMKHHPDRGGDREKFEEVVEAKRQALEEMGE